MILTALDRKNQPGRRFTRFTMRLVYSHDAVKTSALIAIEQLDRTYRLTVIRVAGESGDHIT